MCHSVVVLLCEASNKERNEGGQGGVKAKTKTAEKTTVVVSIDREQQMKTTRTDR